MNKIQQALNSLISEQITNKPPTTVGYITSKYTNGYFMVKYRIPGSAIEHESPLPYTVFDRGMMHKLPTIGTPVTITFEGGNATAARITSINLPHKMLPENPVNAQQKAHGAVTEPLIDIAGGSNLNGGF